MGTVVGTGVLLLVMTACGSAQLGSGSSAGGSTPTLGTSTPAEPPGIAPGEIPPDGKPVSLSKVDASALAPEYPKTVWTQGDGKTVGVIGQEGGCGKVSASVLAQDASSVKIELLETLPLEKKMCTMDIRFPPLTVALDQPLGDRTVVLSSRQEQK
ncbi:hypothetical protein Lesp02_63130 [Lentzea sp. NBRC 105346]|uniref:hypothetical protein n=1 Tax=Lentzea sp. NBRC 105346 TaxID=3032205 RepID=UPI0024A1FD50|nr:hypothetical protein [Lentzea sp. NBRC 105346]GLZ34126.1 hypothetical protein Lesp02_63130 [Lentzea sp. NBRC 105346]